MKSVVRNYVKPILLKYLFLYKEKFLHAPVPPSELTTHEWGNVSCAPAVIEEQVPKIIWLYWHQGSMPIICQQCVKRIKRLNPDFEVNILNSESVHSFLPELAPAIVNIKKEDLTLALYSDLIRLMLLEKFGGFWMDISTILNYELGKLRELVLAKQVELLLFAKPANGYTSNSIKSMEYPVTETWFLGAVKGSKFITDWKNEFLNCLNSPVPSDYYKSDKNYESYVRYLHPSMLEYLLVYISSQVIMRKNKQKYKILFMNAHETGFLYAKSCFWNNELTVKLLTSIKKPNKLPLLIKLTNDTRRISEIAIKNKVYMVDSLMQELVAE